MDEVRDSISNRFQTNIRSLKQGIHHIHDTGDFSDCSFKVGNKHFKAHKLVLSSRCSEFARILLAPNADYEIIVEDESVTEIGFENLLHFIYKDELATTEKTSVVQAYLAGKYYKLRALQQKCEDLMTEWSITVDEACLLLNTSLNIPMLKDRCLNFIRNHASDVISSSGFLDLDLKSLTCILNDGTLKDISAFTRIERVMAWGAKRHTEPVNYSLVRRDMLANQPPLLGLLGFHTLELEQISRIVADYTGLLEPIEVVNLMAFKANGDRTLLPNWS